MKSVAVAALFAFLSLVMLGVILHMQNDHAEAMGFLSRGWFRCNGDKAEFGNINFDRFKPNFDIVCVRQGWM